MLRSHRRLEGPTAAPPRCTRSAYRELISAAAVLLLWSVPATAQVRSPSPAVPFDLPAADAPAPPAASSPPANLGTVPGDASSVNDTQFVEALRQRRLFELAVRYCRQRLAELPPAAAPRADWTVELLHTLAQQAAQAPAEQRPPLWQQAHEAAEAFLRQSPPPPRAVLVRTQQALVLLVQGELARQEWEASLAGREAAETARQVLRQAAGQFEQLARTLTQEIPLRHRSPPRDGELTASALEHLLLHIERQLARAQRNRALLFPPDSEDRAGLLASAMVSLEKLVARTPSDHPQRGELELDLAETYRLAGRLTEAEPLTRRWSEPSQPAPLRLRAQSEQLRLALARKDWNRLAALCTPDEPSGTPGWAEWALARLEGLLALATSGHTPPEAGTRPAWQAQATALARQITRVGGLLAAQRAGRLVAAALPPGRHDPDLLVTAAESLVRESKWDQAATLFEQAAQAARTGNDRSRAFELAWRAAILRQRAGQHPAAAQVLQGLAQDQPDHPQAAAAHLAAAWNLAQHARRFEEALPSYEALLRDHLQRWPAAETADQARLWLARLQLARQQPHEAIDTAAGISPASPQSAAAIPLLAEAWQRELSALASSEATARAEQAIAFFKDRLSHAAGQVPPRGTQADRAAAVALADLILRYQPARAAEAEALLSTLLDQPQDEADPAGQAALKARLTALLAAQPGKSRQATQILQAMDPTHHGELWGLVLHLERLGATLPPDQQVALAEVLLATIGRLEPLRDQLAAEQRPILDRLYAEALAAAGQRDQALLRMEQLAANHPDDGAIQEGLAKMYVAGNDPVHWSKGLAQWRLVAARSPPRSERWFAAKYGVALALYKLGQAEEAARLLKYLLTAPPGMEGSPWEPTYRDLLAQCEAAVGLAPNQRRPARSGGPSGPASTAIPGQAGPRGQPPD